MVDFTNPLEWHEEMLAELPWRVKHFRTLRNRQITMNLKTLKLTQQLMVVIQRAVTSEKAI